MQHASRTKFSLLSLILYTITSYYLKEFPDPKRFRFLGGFSFLTMLRCAKCSFRLVAPPIDHLRNRARGLAVVAPPLFLLSVSIIRTTTPVVRFIYFLCGCMCMLMSVIRPTVHCAHFSEIDVVTTQIKIACLVFNIFTCLNGWRCVATSFSWTWLYMLFLCYYRFAIIVVVKNRMNEHSKIAAKMIRWCEGFTSEDDAKVWQLNFFK